MYITLNLNFKHNFNSNENEKQRLHLNKDPHRHTPPRNIKHDEMIPSHDKVDSDTLRGTGSPCCVLPPTCVHPPLETNKSAEQGRPLLSSDSPVLLLLPEK